LDMGHKEDLFQNLDAAIPGLRRYARALCPGDGSAAADELVQAALERVATKIKAKTLGIGEDDAARHCAYASLTALAREKSGGSSVPRPCEREQMVAQGLANLPFVERASLLLVVLEGLSYDAAAGAVAVPREALVVQLMRARAALSSVDLRPPAPPMDGVRRAGAHLRVIK
jgi:RNA polymerase sigma-70 factor (ECF subfamily)